MIPLGMFVKWNLNIIDSNGPIYLHEIKIYRNLLSNQHICSHKVITIYKKNN